MKVLSAVLAGLLVCGFYLGSARAITGSELMADRRAPESEPQKLFECYAYLNGFIDYYIEMVRWCVFKDTIGPFRTNFVHSATMEHV